jgi:hypothetical protein
VGNDGVSWGRRVWLGVGVSALELEGVGDDRGWLPKNPWRALGGSRRTAGPWPRAKGENCAGESKGEWGKPPPVSAESKVGVGVSALEGVGDDRGWLPKNPWRALGGSRRTKGPWPQAKGENCAGKSKEDPGNKKSPPVPESEVGNDGVSWGRRVRLGVGVSALEGVGDRSVDSFSLGPKRTDPIVEELLN